MYILPKWKPGSLRLSILIENGIHIDSILKITYSEVDVWNSGYNANWSTWVQVPAAPNFCFFLVSTLALNAQQGITQARGPCHGCGLPGLSS